MKCNNMEILITESFFRELSKVEQKYVLSHIFSCSKCQEFYNTISELKIGTDNREIMLDLMNDRSFNENVLNEINSENKEIQNSL